MVSRHRPPHLPNHAHWLRYSRPNLDLTSHHVTSFNGPHFIFRNPQRNLLLFQQRTNPNTWVATNPTNAYTTLVPNNFQPFNSFHSFHPLPTQHCRAKASWPFADDRCAIPLNLFRPFHAPHPSKITKNEDTEKNAIKKYLFPNFTNFKINIRIFINYNYTFYKSIKY